MNICELRGKKSEVAKKQKVKKQQIVKVLKTSLV